MKIGFIGLGIMGESMCENIVKKHDDDVVRCKDCKNNNQCSIQFKFADADNPGNWFCADGKREDKK